ncbi:hypothetical protein OAI07_01210 [Akkermansiaceae bacterium]|nr:hypothetical protein [Akkermansiaceae bacterium]
MNNELQTIETPYSTISVFNPATFAAMVNVAQMMSQSSLIPDCLVRDKEGEFTSEKKASNCLLIVEQSARWQMSPFAVAQHASVIHGKLMWEGKLVASVVAEKLGINLSYTYSGEGENMEVTVSGTLDGEDAPRTVTGKVKDWKTSQWKASDYEQRLAYRGAREWARRHTPSVMLGVYTTDEELPARKMRDVSPKEPINPFKNIESMVEESEPTPTETKPAVGRQKKDRHSKQATLKSVTAKVSDAGKPFYVVTLDNGMKVSDLITFSQTLGKELLDMAEGTLLDIVFTVSSKGVIELEKAKVSEGKQVDSIKVGGAE